MKDAKDRVLGSLVGVHLGDSLGSTWEFQDPERLADEPRVGQLVGGGPFQWRPGAATDDTDQTLATARGILAGCGFSGRVDTAVIPLAVEERLIQWWREGPLDVGSTTSAALSARDAGHDLPTWVHSSLANGSLMRTAPVGLCSRDPRLVRLLAHRVSGITHPNPEVGRVVAAYCLMVTGAVDGGRCGWMRARRDVREGVPELPSSLTNPSTWYWQRDGRWTMGSAWSALRIACWAVHRTLIGTDPMEALLDVIRLGGDTDTNAAIAGGLLGAVCGSRAWPQHLVDRLQYVDSLDPLAHQLTAVRLR